MQHAVPVHVGQAAEHGGGDVPDLFALQRRRLGLRQRRQGRVVKLEGCKHCLAGRRADVQEANDVVVARHRCVSGDLPRSSPGALVDLHGLLPARASVGGAVAARAQHSPQLQVRDHLRSLVTGVRQLQGQDQGRRLRGRALVLVLAGALPGRRRLNLCGLRELLGLRAWRPRVLAGGIRFLWACLPLVVGLLHHVGVPRDRDPHEVALALSGSG